MTSLIQRHPVAHAGFLALALLLFAAVTLALVWISPLLLLVIGGGAGAAAIAVVLLQRPLLALYAAYFLYLVPFGLRPASVDLASTIATNGAIVLAFGAWLLSAPSQRPPILWNGVYFLVALYIIWASVTLLWAHDLVEARHKLIAYFIAFVLLFLIVQQVRSLHALDGIMRVAAMIGWTVIVIGVLTVLLGGYHSGERLKVMDINENLLGLVLLATLPGVIWPVLRTSGARRSFHFVLSFVFILSTLVLVLLSGSRGSTISLVIMLLAYFFWKPLRPWGIFGGMLVASVLMAAPFLLDALHNRFAETWGNEFGDRDILWRASVLLIEDNPLTGVGVGNGPLELPHYIASLTADLDHRHQMPSHNPLLEVGCDTGLIGILLYVSIIVTALSQFFRNRRRLREAGGAMGAYFPIVLCAAVSFFSSFVKGGGLENNPVFFFLLALFVIPSQLTLGSEQTLGSAAEALARMPSIRRPTPALLRAPQRTAGK
jgi:O-antigen ligase